MGNTDSTVRYRLWVSLRMPIRILYLLALHHPAKKGTTSSQMEEPLDSITNRGASRGHACESRVVRKTERRARSNSKWPCNNRGVSLPALHGGPESPRCPASGNRGGR